MRRTRRLELHFARRSKLWAIAALCAAFALTGCAGGGGSGTAAGTGVSNVKPTGAEAVSAAAAPALGEVTVKDLTGKEVTFSEVPSRIAVLSGADLNTVYKLGGTAVGRPTTKNPVEPKEAETAEQIGTAHGVNLEKLALLKPDVVIATAGLGQKDAEAIEALGTRLLLTSGYSVDEVKQSILLVGQVMRKDEKAAELVKEVDAKLAQIQADMSGKTAPKGLVIFGSPTSLQIALPTSLSGDLLAKAGGVNVAADYPGLEKSGGRYAQLSAERIIQSDPDAIYLVAHGDPQQVQAAFEKEMSDNPAWSNLRAVKENRLLVLPSDLFSANPGPKVVEALDYLHKHIAETAAQLQ